MQAKSGEVSYIAEIGIEQDYDYSMTENQQFFVRTLMVNREFFRY